MTDDMSYFQLLLTLTRADVALCIVSEVQKYRIQNTVLNKKKGLAIFENLLY